MIGQENGTSDWVLIDQDRINRFADATEDHQWWSMWISKKRKKDPSAAP